MQELRHDEVADGVVDRRAEEDDPLLEQARVDVERALAAAGLLDDDGDEVVLHDVSSAALVRGRDLVGGPFRLSGGLLGAGVRTDVRVLDEEVERL